MCFFMAPSLLSTCKYLISCLIPCCGRRSQRQNPNNLNGIGISPESRPINPIGNLILSTQIQALCVLTLSCNLWRAKAASVFRCWPCDPWIFNRYLTDPCVTFYTVGKIFYCKPPGADRGVGRRTGNGSAGASKTGCVHREHRLACAPIFPQRWFCRSKGIAANPEVFSEPSSSSRGMEVPSSRPDPGSRRRAGR